MPRNRVQHQKGLSDDTFERLYPDEEACRKGVVRLALARGLQVSAVRGSRVLRDPRP